MNENQDTKEISMSNQSSLEINKTSTGKCSWKVKAYGDTVEQIEDKLRELIEVAKTKERQILS